MICPGGYGAKAEAAVVGLVADEHDEAHAVGLSALQRLGDELAAEALAGKFRRDGERPQQQSSRQRRRR